MRPVRSRRSRASPRYPVALLPERRACPTPSAAYDETPETTSAPARRVRARAASSTSSAAAAARRPSTSAMIAEAVRGRRRRATLPARGARVDLRSRAWSRSGSRPDTGFVMVGERTNITGSKKFAAADRVRRLPGAPSTSRANRSRRREPDRRQHGRRPARRRAGHDPVPQPDRHRAGDRAGADHDRQLEVGGPRGRP